MEGKNNEERICEYIRNILQAPESAVLDLDEASLTQEQQELVAEVRKLGACLLEQKQRLESSARTDALTGVGNRLSFDLQVRRLSEKRLPCTVAFIDIDDLKYCNDHAGHREGDFYIVQVGRLLKDICKDDEQIFRIGGDEFVILSLWATEENLCGRLEAARDSFVRDMSQKVSYPCGFSFGCTQIVDCTLEAYDKLLLTADQRMYQYKIHQKRLRLNRSLGNKHVFGSSYGLESRLFDAMSMTIRHRYIFVCNMNTNVSRWSANAVRDFNLPGEYMEDAGSIWSHFIHPDDRQAYRESIEAVFGGKSSYHDMEYRAMNAKGFYVMCSCKGYRLKGRGNEPDLFVGTIVNKGVIETVDPVTSLHNVYEFINHVNKMRHEHKIVDVLVVGITEFDVINDTYGYSVGNEILRDLAQQLQLLATNEKRLFRLNGMRLAFFLPETTREEVERFNEEVLYTIKNKLYFSGKPVKLYIASAATRYDDWEETPATLLSELDFLLECSKKERGGKLVYMDASRNSEPRRRLAILNAVKRGILNDCEGFRLVYQPQIDIHGHTVGVEALLRWDSPVWGTVPPAEFIPWLEKDICFYDLGLWILKQALRDGMELLKDDAALTMSVNISYKQLERETFLDDVLAVLKQVGFPAQKLVLEFTEHCRTMDIKKLKQLVSDFRRHGLRIAQDDFGTGYSSLMLLRDIHFDIVKIDQNFIRGMLERKADRIIVDSVIGCAHRLDTEICVEGVETEGLLDLVRGYDAEFYQGYVIARPLELGALKKFVKNRSAALT